jgi:hypothetical protein
MRRDNPKLKATGRAARAALSVDSTGHHHKSRT